MTSTFYKRHAETQCRMSAQVRPQTCLRLLVAVVAQPTGFDRMQVEALDLICRENGSDVSVGTERQHTRFRTGADDGQARRFDGRLDLLDAASVADDATANGRRPG